MKCPMCHGTGSLTPSEDQMNREREADLRILRTDFPGVTSKAELVERVRDEHKVGKMGRLDEAEAIRLALAAFGKYLT